MIACNSASAAMLRDARERYDVPVVEVIYPATRRAVAATRNGRIGVICTRSTAESMAYDDAFAAAPHLACTPGPARGSSTSSRPGVTGGDELLAAAHDYLDPLTEAGVDTLILGCTHYPLLTGVISYVMGDDGDPGQQRRGVRQGRLPDARRHRPDARRAASRLLLPHDRLARGVRDRSAAGSSVPRWSPPASSPGGWREAHRRRCSGSYPGPDSPASCYLLEAEPTRAPAAPGGCCSTSAAAPWARCSRYVDPLTIDAVLLSHLHADHCLDMCGYYVLRSTTPPARSRGSRSGGPPAPPTGWPAPTTSRRPRHARGVRLPRLDGRVRIGPFAVEPIRGRPPGRRLRAADHRRRRRRSATAATPRRARAWTRWPTASTCCSPRRRSAHGTTTRPASTSPVATAARSRRATGARRLVLTHVPPWFDPAQTLDRGRRGLRRARSSWPARARSTSSEPPPRR